MGRMAGGRGWSQAEHNYAKNCYDTQSFCAATTPLTSYFGDAYNSIIDPIIAMSSRWNSTAFDSHSTSMFRLCYRVLCIFFNLFPV